MKYIFLIIKILLLSNLAFGSDNNSDNLTVPHTFNSGETISSSKMNENFSNIYSILNHLQKKVFINNQYIGEFISFFKNEYDSLNKMLVKSDKGYFFELLESSHISVEVTYVVNQIRFTGNNCTGQMMTELRNNIRPNYIYRKTENSDDLIYINADDLEYHTTYSYLDDDGINCRTGEASANYIKVFSNDPNITGLNQSNFTGFYEIK